jgi:hypothetical protein
MNTHVVVARAVMLVRCISGQVFYHHACANLGLDGVLLTLIPISKRSAKQVTWAASTDMGTQDPDGFSHAQHSPAATHGQYETSRHDNPDGAK